MRRGGEGKGRRRGGQGSGADAERRLELLCEVYCMVNVIVVDPHEGTAIQNTEEEQVCGWCKHWGCIVACMQTGIILL